jgi:hypothetical protein
MPLTPNLSTITVTGSYVNAAGAPVSGSVTFTPTVAVVDAAYNQIVVPSPVTVTLASGSFSVALPVTDDADLTPSGWTYTVTETFTGGRTYSISLPASLGATVDLADLGPTVTSTGNAALYASYTQFVNVNNRLLTLESSLTGANTAPTAAANAATSAQAAASAASITVAGAGIHPFLLAGC